MKKTIRFGTVLALLALGGGLLLQPTPAQAKELTGAVDPLAPLPDHEEAPPPASETAIQLTDWVLASGDNGGLPFIIVDKVRATVFAFDSIGEFYGRAPVLVGITPGDESSPGVGDRELSDIRPEERTTPAGRFQARIGPATGIYPEVLWVDYATSIALHPVVTANKKERRPERLQSPTADDNRITYGCINVPPAFYQHIVRPLFQGSGGIAYIIPEIKNVTEVFPGFTPAAPLRTAEGSPAT